MSIDVFFLIATLALIRSSATNPTPTSCPPRTTCKLLKDCPEELSDLQNHRRFPHICGFEGGEIKSCCKRPVGAISKKKCAEYSIYAYEETNSTKKVCPIAGLVPLIVGGENVDRKEFPHMVALGTDQDPDKPGLSFFCGGSLISDRFVLTAVHCLYNGEKNVTHVRIGVTELNGTDHRQDIKVSNITIIHPEYNISFRYHDIALIKLEQKVHLNPYARPACLYPKMEFEVNRTIATGWGTTGIGEGLSNSLLKTELSFVDMETCMRKYEHSNNKLNRGILESQFCAMSGTDRAMDTCQGDSGGPLQWYHLEDGVKCMYDIIGITSFGRDGCFGTPAVYVRVSYYLKWIEENVWPDESE